MQPKKHSIKLKTLTLTLALATGMNITSGLATDSGAKKLGDAIENFLTDYKAYTTVGTNADQDNAAGAYSATAVNATKGITGKANLDAARFKSLYASAKDIDSTNTAEVGKVFGTMADNNSDKAKALKAAFGELATDLDMDSTDSDNKKALELLSAIHKAVNNADNISAGDTAANTKVAAITTNYSTETLDNATAQKLLVVAIDALNDAIDDAYNLFNTNDLGTKEARKAFFDYAAAYVTNEIVSGEAIKGKDFTSEGLAAATANSSALYTKVAASLAQGKQQEYLKKKGLHQITTDDQLKAVVAMKTADIETATTLTKSNAKDLLAITAHLKKAKDETDAAKKVVLQNQAAASLTPNVNNQGRATAAPVVKVANNTVEARMQVLNNTGMSSGDEFGDSNVWLRATHLNYEADEKDDRLGYKQKSSGFGVGIDQQINEKFSVGLSYNYVKSNVNGEDDYMLEDDIKSNAFGAYITMMHDGMFADAQFNYIKNKTEGMRTIGTGTAVAPVSYKFDGDVFNAVIGVGMDVSLDNDWYVKPKACLAFSNYKTDKYNEMGSMLAATEVDQSSSTSVEVGLQFIFGADMMMDNCKLNPKMKLGFMYDLNDKADKATYTFVGEKFSVEGIKRDRSNFNVGAGVGVMLDQLCLDLGYDFKWSSNSKAHGFIAKVGYMF